MALTAKTERDNFSRLGQGIVGIGNAMARDLLSSYINPTALMAKVIPGGRPTHSVWYRLRKDQQDLVRNAGRDGYTKFDICLIYTLLRNVCTNLGDPSKQNLPAPTQGWDKDPQQSDITPSDDMERLRKLRNAVYGHVSEPFIKESEYKIHWQELKYVASRMQTCLGGDYLKDLEEAEIYKMSDADVKEIIQKIKEYSREIKEHTKETAQEQNREIKEHTTETAQKCSREIKEHNEEAAQEQIREIKEHTTETAQKCSREIKEHNEETVQEQTREIKDYIKQTTQKFSREIKDCAKKQGKHISWYFRKKFQQSQEMKARKQEQEKKNHEAGISKGSIDHEQGVKKLDTRLQEINNALTESIPLAPLEQDGDTMPLELLFASVVITEDIKSHDRRNFNREQKAMPHNSSSQSTREVSTPADIFMIDSKYARKIFLKGDAAHGKTTYCLWLLRKWCDAKSKIKNREKLDEWEKAVQKFNFVFLIQFRYVNPNRSNVIDMICNDLFEIDTDYHDAIRRVLSSDLHKSLIILDGLDEWNPNEEVRKQLTCPEMPKLEGLSNGVTCFISMRPWLFPIISKMKGDNTRVLEIHGLSWSAMKKVIENVLCNHYNLEKDTLDFKARHEKIQRNLKEMNLELFMKIPLLAVVCVQLFCEEEYVEDSITCFYTNMLNMLIERSHLQHESTKQMSCQTDDSDFPKILTAKKCIRECISVLLRLGKVAFEGLISHKRKLEFQEDELRSELGVNGLQFALNVGLISQNETRSITTRKVIVHFFHKCIQEFLAAIYVSQNDVTGSKLCGILSSIEVVMQWSYVIRFICGLSPSLGSTISRHIYNLVDSKNNFCEDRKLKSLFFATILYEQQVNWLKEIRTGQTITGKTVVFFVSDVVLSEYSDNETVRVTMELLEKDHFDEIRSLSLTNVSMFKDNEKFETMLRRFLFNTSSLVNLSLEPYYPTKFEHSMRIQTLRVLRLHRIEICSIYLKNTPLLSNIPNLHTLSLSHITFQDVELMYTPFLSDMPNLIRIELELIYFSGTKLETTLVLSNLPKLRNLQVSRYKDVKVGKTPLLYNVLNSHSLELNDISYKELKLGNSPLLSNMPYLNSVELKYIICNGLKMKNTPLLSNMQNLRRLKLEDIFCDELQMENTALLSNMPKLNRLELRYISCDGMKMTNTPLLSNMPNLHRLQLHIINDLKLEYTPLLSNMPNLHILEIIAITFDELTLGDTPLLSNLPNMRKLYLTDISCKELKWEDTPLLSNMPKVHMLRLSSIWFNELNLKDTPLLSNMPVLHKLNLSNIECIKMKQVDTPLLSNMPNLHSLFMSIIEFNEIELDNTSLLSDMPNLHILELQFIACKNLKLENISLLSNMPNIRAIYLHYVSIPMTLELSSDMTHLKVITLCEVHMSEAGWKRFISSLTQIQHRFRINLIYEKMAEKMFFLTCHASDFTKTAVRYEYVGKYKPTYVCTYIGRYIHCARHIGIYEDMNGKQRLRRRVYDSSCGKSGRMYGRFVNRYVGKYVKYIFVGYIHTTKISFERVWPVSLNTT